MSSINDTTGYISEGKVKSADELAAMDIRAQLERLAGVNSSSEDAIIRHKTPENKVSIAENLTTAKAAQILADAATAEQEEQDFYLEFDANPWDGAMAFHNVLRTWFGTTGRPVTVQTMFGPKKPSMIDIETGYGETTQITWGRFAFAIFEGTIDLSMSQHPDYGDIFAISITCPKKFAGAVLGLKKMIQEEIRVNSIYKGKAIRITSGDRPRFINLQIDTSIVYNDEVMDRLDDAIWAPLRHTEMLRNDVESKIDPQVLLYGPYGTGKSECGRLTARRAVDNGWTFISYDSGKGTMEDLRKALQTAKLFAPSVVFVEDVDIYAEAADSGHARSRLLEMFDGISAKNKEVLVVMTSNKAEKLDKGMMRPGRIDDMIEIGNLDRKASEKLIKLVNGEQLADDIDFDAIYKHVELFEPAFLRRTFTKARQRALVRTADELNQNGNYSERRAHEFKLTTEDFVSAARIMAAQHDKHGAASDSSRKITSDDLARENMAAALHSYVELTTSDGAPIGVNILDENARRELTNK